ncbi:MAG: glycosyl hydrolase family 18 protein [Sedimentibacter sp.]|uniref:glycosyl hydrolase family 18 protein n=1 Tax=Sedimentibacter sp. TaxID=1960295 RepID=UPI0029822696|nr:glycosyl hydrolase family 18 protein [Sedimentibacter sp.]MDW5298779.1 glycosyl hydrolase family 18 protein [Sedimentibacter sp.]
MKRKIIYFIIAISIMLLCLEHENAVFSVESNQKAEAGFCSEEDTDKSKKVIVGYYPAWKSYSGYTPDKIDVSKLTHINYAFANIGSDLRITMGYPDKDVHNFEILQELKESNPELKTLISVGGWNWSGKFSDAASTEETRTEFAESCVEFITKYGFDGVDLDWEYPVGGGLETNSKSLDDKQNFTLLLKNIREKLDAQGMKDNKHYLLTVAAGVSNYYIKNTEAYKFHNYLDYVTLMTYDIHGPWDFYSDFNGPLYNNHDVSPQYKISIDSSVKAWLKAGLPKDKLVIGIPFYGYKYDVLVNLNNGLYQEFSKGNALSYDSIVSNYINNPDYIRYFHEESLVPWLFNGTTFISYDDARSIGLKAEYINEQNLGGAMVWELSQETEGVLLGALYDGLYQSREKDFEGHWAQDEIQKWFEMEYIAGYTDGSFKPEEFVTRAEFIKMANNLFNFTETCKIAFLDVNEDDWCYEEVQKAYKAGYIIGESETQFAPNDFITREQAAIIITRLLNIEGNESEADVFVDSSQISSWSKEYVGAAAKMQIIKGYDDNSFKPQNNIKRSEAVVLLDRVLINYNS